MIHLQKDFRKSKEFDKELFTLNNQKDNFQEKYVAAEIDCQYFQQIDYILKQMHY